MSIFLCQLVEAPSWNVPVTSSAPSLAEIQRMEEKRQMLNLEKLKQMQAHEQQLQQQQQQQQRLAAGWSDKRCGFQPIFYAIVFVVLLGHFPASGNSIQNAILPKHTRFLFSVKC